MKAFRLCVVSAIVTATGAFVIFQFAPMSIVSLFGSESDLYNEFAVKSLRIFLLFCVLNSFQTVASIFMQAIERPIQAMALSLSRQIVFLVPAIIVLPKYFGIDGVLWAGPVADLLAFMLAFVVTMTEIRRLNFLT